MQQMHHQQMQQQQQHPPQHPPQMPPHMIPAGPAPAMAMAGNPAAGYTGSSPLPPQVQPSPQPHLPPPTTPVPSTDVPTTLSV